MKTDTSSKPRLIIFGHIPKTAGSTFKMILWRQYDPSRVFFSMTPATHAEKFAELRRRLEGEGEGVDVLVTHAGYGVHETLPDTHEYPYITFLREPVDRVISGYHMFLRQGKAPKDMPLDDFVRTFLKPGCNMQTSFLSGYFLECHLAGREPELEAFDEEMLEKAKRNLERHAVIGLTERFDESLIMLRNAFGWDWHKLLYYRANVGTNRKPRDGFSAETLKTVERYNRLDLELYDYARMLFEERIEARRGEIERSLNAFNAVNRFYEAVAPRVLPPARSVYRSFKKIFAR